MFGRILRVFSSVRSREMSARNVENCEWSHKIVAVIINVRAYLFVSAVSFRLETEHNCMNRALFIEPVLKTNHLLQDEFRPVSLMTVTSKIHVCDTLSRKDFMTFFAPIWGSIAFNIKVLMRINKSTSV